MKNIIIAAAVVGKITVHGVSNFGFSCCGFTRTRLLFLMLLLLFVKLFFAKGSATLGKVATFGKVTPLSSITVGS